jgi:hypothetical protein
MIDPAIQELLDAGRLVVSKLHNLSRYVVRCDGVIYRDVPGRQPMATRINDEGYPKLKLVCDDGKRREFFVHILVAKAFLPPPKPGQRYVLHGNGGRTDCHYSNLRWGTHHDNHDDKKIHGTVPKVTRKLLPKDVRKIRESKLGAAKLAKRMGLSISHVREVRNGRRWKNHAGAQRAA